MGEAIGILGTAFGSLRSPGRKQLDDLAQKRVFMGERVANLGWPLGVDFPFNEPIFFQVLKDSGKRLCRNPRKALMKLAEAFGPVENLPQD